jgi:6-phosphogluconate dehydrogenase (decarboxylating)
MFDLVLKGGRVIDAAQGVYTFAEKILSAMRFGFGGHVELPVPKS